MKKFFLFILIVLLIAGGVVYHYRYEIFQVSAEGIVKDNLPPYVSVKSIVFDLEKGTMKVEDLGIKNPKGFSGKFLARIDMVTCRYKMIGENILDGIEVTEIVAENPVIYIERLSNGKMNVNEMGSVLEEGNVVQTKESDSSGKVKAFFEEKMSSLKLGKRDITISNLLKLTDTIEIKDGKVMFEDSFVTSYPYKLTFEDVNTPLVIKLSKDYTSVFSVATTGSGLVNGDGSQRVSWDVSLDPTANGLTMDNTFDVRGVEITQFKPYYEKYSPIDIESGRFSGSLVFNFNHGSIGSTNTVYLSGARFSVKKGAEGAKYWQGSFEDVLKYLQSSPGEFVFDFKIKGDMNNPRFYPGPKVKSAMQSMVVDKVVDMFAPQEQGSGGASAGSGGGQAPMSNEEKVMELLKGFLN